jgi:hypothetical protein
LIQDFSIGALFLMMIRFFDPVSGLDPDRGVSGSSATVRVKTTDRAAA